MLVNIVLGLHLVVCLLLILFVLLHAGRGGGLSEMFGGGGGAGGLGGSTVAEKNLDRMTITTALIFTVTTFALAFMMKD